MHVQFFLAIKKNNTIFGLEMNTFIIKHASTHMG